MRTRFHSCLFLYSAWFSLTSFVDAVWGFSFRRNLLNRHSTSTPSSSLTMVSESSDGVPLKDGQVLGASSESSEISFDTQCVAYPVVLPPWKTGCSKWKMFYYGRGAKWNGGHFPLLPTGWVGLAESTDGIHWSKAAGQEEGGSVMAPSDDPDAFDHVHIGHGDIVPVAPDCWYMFYFGASNEAISMAGNEVVGFRMRIGRAVSRDQGLTWEKLGVALDYDESEGWFASWPRVIVNSDDPEQPWQMNYHAYNGQNWRVYGTYSHDQGATWIRNEDGKPLLSGDEEDESSWDFRGVGTRALVPRNSDWLMIYEGVDKAGVHRIGTAISKGSAMGPWSKDVGPILEPGVAPLQQWTDLVIGTPYVLASEDDKSLWLYYVGVGNAADDKKHAIGLVVSESGSLDQWTQVAAD